MKSLQRLNDILHTILNIYANPEIAKDKNLESSAVKICEISILIFFYLVF